jgi:hypothetical protein
MPRDKQTYKRISTVATAKGTATHVYLPSQWIGKPVRLSIVGYSDEIKIARQEGKSAHVYVSKDWREKEINAELLEDS